MTRGGIDTWRRICATGPFGTRTRALYVVTTDVASPRLAETPTVVTRGRTLCRSQWWRGVGGAVLYVAFDEVWSLGAQCGGHTDVARESHGRAKPKIDRIGQHGGLGGHFSCQNMVVVRWMEGSAWCRLRLGTSAVLVVAVRSSNGMATDMTSSRSLETGHVVIQGRTFRARVGWWVRGWRVLCVV